jgi:protein SCO1
MSRSARALVAVERFFTGHRFPALVLGVLALFALGIGAVLLIPAADTGAGAFAEEFRIWCFGADPATGASSALMVGVTYLEFAGLALMVALVWKEPLRAALAVGPRAFGGVAVGVLGVAALAVAGFVALARDRPVRVDPTVFQAQALRVAVPAPDFELVDHQGRPARLSDEKGRVVLVTAVYASCGLTCPRILGQAKRAVATLEPREREGLSVLGITLDPERDTPEALAKLVEAQQVHAPLYRLLTGDPAAVNRALDRFDVSRRRDEKTGRIDHANLFLLIDREGKLAYRFTLDPLQEKWLGEALRLLLAEGGSRSARRN